MLHQNKNFQLNDLASPTLTRTAAVHSVYAEVDLAGLMAGLVTPMMRVSGLYKPDAGLLGVVSEGPPPLTISTMLIAGSKDVALSERYIQASRAFN